jgi:hypothetical protein
VFHFQDFLLRPKLNSWWLNLQVPSLISNHCCRLRWPRTRDDQEENRGRRWTVYSTTFNFFLVFGSVL